MWSQIGYVLSVTLLLSACDNFGEPHLSFPAKLSGMEALETERSLFQEGVERLLDKVGSEFLVYDESLATSHISIAVVNEINPNTSGIRAHSDVTTVMLPTTSASVRGVAPKTRIAGRATRFRNECKIEIARFVVDYGESLLEPVLWHEIGHCAGLRHVQPEGEIMSAVTYPIQHYDAGDLERFLQSLQSAIR